MPKEVRYLLFSNEELYQALINDLRARAYPLPRGFLKNIHIGTPDRPEISLVFVSDKGVESTIRFEDQEVLRSLIVYCGQRRIPLSAKSLKSLEIKESVIGLLCTLNFNSDTITSSGGKLSYQDKNTDRMKEAAKSVAVKTTAAKAATPGTTPLKTT